MERENRGHRHHGKFCWYKGCPMQKKNKLLQTNSRFKFPKYTYKYNSKEEYDEKLSQWVHHCGNDKIMSMYLEKKPSLHEMSICSLHFRPEDMYYNGKCWSLHRLAVPIDFNSPQTPQNLGCAVVPGEPNILQSPKSEKSTPNSQDPFEFLDVSYKAVKSELSSTADGMQLSPATPNNDSAVDVSRQTNLADNKVLVNSVGLNVESSSVTSHTGMEQDTKASTERQDEPPRELCMVIKVQQPEKKSDGFRGFSSLKTETDLREICGISLRTFKLLLSLLPLPTTYINTHLSPEDCLLSFLLQMKTGNSFTLTKNLFCMSSVIEATRIFTNILFRLKNQTQQFIVWPDKQTVISTMPDLFRRDYVNCRVILYCLEVQLQSPNHTYQSESWYAECVKKILIGFTPSGSMSFVSKVFPGDFTLMEIILNSDILKLLKLMDFVFLVFDDNQHYVDWNQLHKFVSENDISILLPPRYQNQIETNQTPQETQIWAHAVDQIKRVKSHKILYNCSLENMGGLLENIVFMACVLANLQPRQESVPSNPAQLEI